MTSVKATHPPTDTPVGTVRQDQRGMQWTCRHLDDSRGPLYTPSCITTPVLPTFMASEDELADSGVLLTAVAA